MRVIGWLGLAVLASAVAAQAPPPRYNVGTCAGREQSGPHVDTARARKAGDWATVVEQERENVRRGCWIGYRWFLLADALLQAHRESEALLVLEEVESRRPESGFVYSPQVPASIESFRKTPLFLQSELGMRTAELQKASDARREKMRAELKRMPAGQKPPERYVAKGACPFECCTYRTWTVVEDTVLVAAPGSKVVVGTARKGRSVRGLTGEVHLRPEPVVVLQEGPLRKGSIAFLLDYQGEGYAHFYSDGKITSLFAGVEQYCTHIEEACWAETLARPEEKRKPVWWVKIRLPGGVVGWSNQPGHFGNKDSCG
jgi:hypothetical protein